MKTLENLLQEDVDSGKITQEEMNEILRNEAMSDWSDPIFDYTHR